VWIGLGDSDCREGDKQLRIDEPMAMNGESSNEPMAQRLLTRLNDDDVQLETSDYDSDSDCCEVDERIDEPTAANGDSSNEPMDDDGTNDCMVQTQHRQQVLQQQHLV
jgi:hypothetical protein